MPTISLPKDLKRYPATPRERLQAWDSADELLIEQLSALELQGRRILIINDAFGALSSSLGSHEDFELTSYSDSYLSCQAITLNSGGRVKPIHRLQEFSGTYDLAVLRIPKNMSFLEDILCHLSAHLRQGSQLISGYMIKHQAKASFDLIARLIGDTRTSLAKKKARLIFAEFQRGQTQSPFPLGIHIDSFEKPFTHSSNLFSREKLDIGTRFLLEHIPQGDFRRILDLGCANGILGIAAKKKNPGAQILFSDESWMAIESAEANYRTSFTDNAQLRWTDCFESPESESLDLVLCNPPFHQGHGMTLGDSIARRMFRDSHQALARGGVLRVIGNSHLGYPSTLRKIFGNSRTVATNNKFTIVDAVKR